MITIDMTKANSVEDCKVESITVNQSIRGVVTIPVEENFRRLIGYCNTFGDWIWVHKNFQKNTKKSLTTHKNVVYYKYQV
jgi:hypothetical protein